MSSSDALKWLNENFNFVDSVTIIDHSGTIIAKQRFNPRYTDEENAADNQWALGKNLLEVFPGQNFRSSALLAALSIFFCELLHVTPKLYRKFFPNIYLRVAAGGVLIIALTKLLGTTDYNGAGAAVIEAAIDGEAVPYAFLLKMLFTALTLGAGFKGGEIVPIFFTGATFGCVAAPLLGLPPQLGAALGMVALFCGCTNSPLASICLAIEVFGGQCVSLFALACAVSYMLSSYFSLYREQHFLHSKLRIVGVQRVHGHWSETDAAHLTTNGDGEN